MTQHIDTVPIEYLPPYYIKKYITEKIGILKNKTRRVVINTHLDCDEMETRGYSKYIIFSMRLRFEVSCASTNTPSVQDEKSIEYSLKKFCNARKPHKIISVIPDGDYYICIVWEDDK